MITGRFDFCLSERGLKVYEYNCDSASCHMDAGKVQGRWAEHFGCAVGADPGERLQRELAEAWCTSDIARRRAPDEVLHIMIDRDLEETYHALFMKEALDAAGIPSKLLHGMSDTAWNDAGEVVDGDGVAIRGRRAAASSGDGLRAAGAVGAVRRPSLSAAFLLRADRCAQSRRFVTKPIVGRCDANISLFDKKHYLIEKTSGRFDDQEQIYQELFRLPRVDGEHVQLCTFTAEGTYAGACVRVDPSLVITADSDIVALRVIDDDDFLEGDWPGHADEQAGYRI